MVRRNVQANGRDYGFAPDDLAPELGRAWGLLLARAVDEVTGEPPPGGLSIETARAGMHPRVGSDGLVGLAGIPLRVFQDLNATDEDVDYTVRADGYLPFSATATIPLDLDVTGVFTPHEVGDLPMRREPVVIRGRTALSAGGAPTTPVAGATVTVTGIWPQLPAPNTNPPADPPLIAYLRPGLYFRRDPVNDRVRRRELPPFVGEDKRLLGPAPAGSTSVQLSDRVNVVVGSVLSVGASDPERREYVSVAVVDGATTPDQPARITFTHPLGLDHLPDEPVVRVDPQPAGGDNQLARETIAGDQCVVLDGLIDLAGAGAVEVSGGAEPAEFHAVRLYTAVSNADGYFRLPPINRVARLRIEADDAVHPVITQVVVPNYASGEHILDFVFRTP